MQVEFTTRRLQLCYEQSREGAKEWGEAVGRKYIQRLNVIFGAKDLEGVRSFRAFRLHPLKGPRTGQYALTLHDRWRLIITPLDANTVRVDEVSNHYDD